MWKKVITAYIILAVIGAAFALYAFFTSRNSITVRDGAAVIKQMQELNRLETASYTIEKIIDAGTNGNAFQNLLFGDKILLIAHGEVIAGFNLSQLTEEDIIIEGTSLRISIPAPEILVTRLDSEQTRVYDRSQGLLTKGDKDLESEARSIAEETIRKAACESGILDKANENAQEQLEALFKTTGFETVEISVTEGTCS